MKYLALLFVVFPLIHSAPIPAPVSVTKPASGLTASFVLDTVGPLFIKSDLKICLMNSSGKNVSRLQLANEVASKLELLNVRCQMNHTHKWEGTCKVVDNSTCNQKDEQGYGDCLYAGDGGLNKYGCMDTAAQWSDGPVYSLATAIEREGIAVTFENATKAVYKPITQLVISKD